MPAPRTVDLLPPEHLQWLKDELRARGFAGYVRLADDLNARLREAGVETEIQKSALHKWGKEQKERFREEDAERFKFLAETQALVMERVAKEMKRTAPAASADRARTILHQLTAMLFDLNAKLLAGGGSAKEVRAASATSLDLVKTMRLLDSIQSGTRAEKEARLNEAVDRGELHKEAVAAARRIMGFA